MKPAPFEYHAPRSVEDAVGLLHELEEADEEPKCLAGGQSLVPMMNLRLARPTHLVDLRSIGELQGIETTSEGWRIGALTTHAALEDDRQTFQELALLPYVASHIGYRAIRSRGTIGGALCHADPVAEWPMIARLLDAELDVVGPSGARVVPASDFFMTVFTPTIAPDELLRSISIQRPADSSTWGFSEFARKVGDYAVVAASVVLDVEDGAIARARVALSGVDSTPHRSTAADEELRGGDVGSTELHRRAADAAAEAVAPQSDLHGTSDYRRQLVRAEITRALAQATSTLGEAT